MQENNLTLLRSQLKQARHTLTEAARQQGALLIQEHLSYWVAHTYKKIRSSAPLQHGPLSIGAFWPLPDEPDLRPLLTQWCQEGLSIALPALDAPGQPFEFRAWSSDAPMQAGRYNIAEPTLGNVIRPSLILVPTLGYSAHADRIGYGKGYYDRTLATLKRAGHIFTTIGIAWSCGRLNTNYQPAAHDVRLNAILTPDGWVPQAPIS